ncbi:membrane-associating domain-containing protein [Jackrogersella minutella]|nr:membrane-associating domain-containing protein [Jackrogersella minutella]
MLKIASLAVRSFLLLFGAVVLGLSVTLAKQQEVGSPPSETSFGSFCGAFGILISLIGLASVFIDKLPAFVVLAADGIASALYLAGAIALTIALKSASSCTSNDNQSQNDRYYNKLLNGGCQTLDDGGGTYCPGAMDDGLLKGRCQRVQADYVFEYLGSIFGVAIIAIGFVIGTHNSYHRESPLEAREVQTQLLPNVTNYYYSHATLDIQASYQSVRSFELDIFADPDGGRYANPLVIQKSGGELPPQDVMNKPGVKVLHIADADVWPSCYTLVGCLTVVKNWSEAHPGHVPIPFMIEFKTAETGTGGNVAPLPWNDTALLDDLDTEIRSVFPPSKLITADDLRHDNFGLEESVLKYGWPDLDSARGRVLFLMDNEPGPIRNAYTSGRPNLEDRVIFTNSKPGYTDCAFQKLNDPRNATNLANIQKQVRAGYWVRTRSDEPLTTILSNDTTYMRESALASGAQIVSTDFPSYGLTSRWHVEYAVRFEGGKAVRCNPVTAGRSCVEELLELI